MTANSADSRIAFDQRIARRVAGMLARTPVTPNAVTASSVVVGLAAAWLLGRGDGWIHLGAALFVVAVWMDHVDGELARQTDRTSTFGHYFDLAAALATYVAGFVGAGFGLRHGPLGDWGPVLGISAGIAVAAIIGIRLLVELRDGQEAVRQTVRGGFEIEDILYIFAPVTWFGLLQYFILAAGIGAPVFLIYVVWTAAKGSRKPPPVGTGGT